jgi:excinuclease UvrABC ATPase subunit
MNDLLLRLRDKGNTVLVVEHEPETIRCEGARVGE